MFTTIKSRLASLLRPASRAFNTDQELAAAIRSLFGQCPACAGSLDGHAHWRLAAALVDGETGDAARLATLIRSGRWEDAAKEARWAHDKDVREYHAIRCPRTGRTGLVAAVFTHEFWSKDYVESARVLAEEDAGRVQQLAKAQWRPL